MWINMYVGKRPATFVAGPEWFVSIPTDLDKTTEFLAIPEADQSPLPENRSHWCHVPLPIEALDSNTCSVTGGYEN